MRLIAEHPDLALILLDLGLPDRDGFLVLAEIRERHPTIPLVLSGHHDRANVVRALDLGVLGFIPKTAQRQLSPCRGCEIVTKQSSRQNDQCTDVLQFPSGGWHGPGTASARFERFSEKGAQGLLVLTDPMLRVQARRIVELAAIHRLPAMYGGTWFLEAGGLASYSANFDAMIRRVAYYVDRILKGARPATLPLEQPTKFELVFNLKTAKALGLYDPGGAARSC